MRYMAGGTITDPGGRAGRADLAEQLLRESGKLGYIIWSRRNSLIL